MKVDVFSPAKRSEVMSRVKSRGNAATELVVLRLLRLRGITGWRRHMCLPGTPDFAFPRERVAVFVDGCYWHGCPRCKRFPKANSEFWTAKFAANQARDRRTNRALRGRGWSVVRIWQCRLKQPEAFISRLLRALKRTPR